MDPHTTGMTESNFTKMPRRATESTLQKHENTKNKRLSHLGLGRIPRNLSFKDAKQPFPAIDETNTCPLIVKANTENQIISVVNQIRDEKILLKQPEPAFVQPASGYFGRVAGGVGYFCRKTVQSMACAGFDPQKISDECRIHLREITGDNLLADAIQASSCLIRDAIIELSSSIKGDSWLSSLVNWLVQGEPKQVQAVIEANLMRMALHLAIDTAASIRQGECRQSAYSGNNGFVIAMIARLLMVVHENMPAVEERIKGLDILINSDAKQIEKKALFTRLAEHYLRILFPNKEKDLVLPPVINWISSLWPKIEESVPSLLAWVYDEWISREREACKNMDNLMKQPGARDLLNLFDKVADTGKKYATRKLSEFSVSHSIGMKLGSYLFYAVEDADRQHELGRWLGGVLRGLALQDQALQPIWDGIIRASRALCIHMLSSASSSNSGGHIINTFVSTIFDANLAFSEEYGEFLETKNKEMTDSKSFPAKAPALSAGMETTDLYTTYFFPLADSLLDGIGLSPDKAKGILPEVGKKILGFLRDYLAKFAEENYLDVIVPMNKSIAKSKSLCGERPLKNSLDALIRYLSPSLREVMADSSHDLVRLAIEQAVVWMLPEKIGSGQEKMIAQGLRECILNDSPAMEIVWEILEENVTRLIFRAVKNLASSFPLHETLEEAQAARRILPTTVFHIMALFQKHSNLFSANFHKRLIARSVLNEEDKKKKYDKKLQETCLPLSYDICKNTELELESIWEVPGRFKQSIKEAFANSILPYLLLRLYGDLYLPPSRTDEEKKLLHRMDPENLMPLCFHNSGAAILNHIRHAIGLGISDESQAHSVGNLSQPLDCFVRSIIELFSDLCGMDALSESDKEWLSDDLRVVLQKQAPYALHFEQNTTYWIAGILQQVLEHLALAYAAKNRCTGSILKNAILQFRDVLCSDETSQLLGSDLTEKILAYENSAKIKACGGYNEIFDRFERDEETYNEILDRFRKLLRYLFSNVGIKNPTDLKVPFFLQAPIWNFLLSGTVLPEFCFNLYREIWVRPLQEYWIPPKDEESEAQLVVIQNLSATLSFKITEALQNAASSQKQPIAFSLISLCQELGFTMIPEGSLEELLAELAESPSEMNRKMWDSLSKILEMRLYSFLCYISFQHSADHTNPILNTLLKLFTTCNACFAEFSDTIEDRCSEILAMEEGTAKLKQVQDLFGELANRLLCDIGLEKNHHLRLPFFHEPLLSWIKDEVLPGFLFNAYADMMLSVFHKDQDRVRLKELLFNKTVLSSAQLFELTDVSVNAATLKEQIWQLSGTSVLAENIETAFSAISAMIVNALDSSLQNNHEILSDHLIRLYPMLGESAESMFFYREAFAKVLEGPFFKNMLKGIPQLLEAALLRIFVNIAETTDVLIPCSVDENPNTYLLGNMVVRIINLMQKYQEPLHEAYEALREMEEAAKWDEMRKACIPLANEVLCLPGDDILQELPIFSFLKPILTEYLKNTLLPGFFAKTYLDSKLFEKQAVQAKTRLENHHKSDEVGQAIHTISEFSSRLLQHQMADEREIFVNPLFDNIMKSLSSQAEHAQELIRYIEVNRLAVNKWLGDNLFEWQAVDVPAVKMCGDYISIWLESALLKFIEGVSSHVESFENRDGSRYNRNSMEDLALKILEKATIHFRIVQNCTEDRRKKHAYTVAHLDKLKAFEGLDAKAGETKANHLHPGMPNSAAYEAYLNLFNAAKIQIKHQERIIAKWRGKSPGRIMAAEEVMRAAWKNIQDGRENLEQIRMDHAYKPFSNKLLQMAGISEPKDLGLDAMPSEIWIKFTETILPGIVRNLCGSVGQIDNINSLLLNLVRNVNDRLSKISPNPSSEEILHQEELTLEEIQSEQIKQREWNERCGHILHEFVRYLPESITESLFMIGKLRTMANEQAGIVLRLALKDLKMSDIIGQLIKSAAANLPDEQSFATEEELKRRYEQQKALMAKEVDRAISHETVNTVNILKENFWESLNQKWVKFQEGFDAFIAKHFPKNGPRIKAFLDFFCRKIFINMLGAFIQMLLYIPYKLIWACIELHTAYQAEVVKRNVHDPINENLFYAFMDTVLDHYPKEPSPAIT